jgi:spermidine synthase
MALQTEPPLTGAGDTFRATLQRERDTLHTFYGAGLAAYRGDREAWARDVQRVMSTDGGNPYYRWFVGDARQ